MTTTLYLRNTQVNGIGANYFDMLLSQGSVMATATVAAAAGTDVVTQFASMWISPPLAAPVTLTTSDIRVMLHTSVAPGTQAAGGRYQLFKRTAAGVETSLGAATEDNVQITTSSVAYAWTNNITDTSFQAGDRILLKMAVSAEGGGQPRAVIGAQTVSLRHNISTSNSYLNITPDCVFEAVVLPAIVSCCVDTPTNFGVSDGFGGEVHGNYCTWNPLDGNGTISEGNLRMTNGAASHLACRSTMAVPRSGKWYAECNNLTQATTATNAWGFGLATPLAPLSAVANNNANLWLIYASNTGQLWSQTTQLSNTLGTFPASTILKIAIDMDNKQAWVGKNADWYNATGDVGNPTAGTGPTFTSLPDDLRLWMSCYAMTGYLNSGQRAWKYRAPTGFKGLCSHNLPPPTVALPATFQGNASANGPYVWAAGAVETVTINGNVATRVTHFDRVAGGIKLRTTSASYNANASNTITAATYGASIKYSRGQINP